MNLDNHRVPSEGALRRVVEDVFWSSLDQYEGNPIRARIFFASREALSKSFGIINLATSYPISLSTIRQLSPAHSSAGGLIAVEHSGEEVAVEGILGKFPSIRGGQPLWLCVESRGPGTLRVSIGEKSILEFARGTVKQLGGMSFDRNSAEILLLSNGLLPAEIPGFGWHIASALLDIGFSMERHGTGGALWILPAGHGLVGNLEGLGKRIGMSGGWWDPYREIWERRTSMIQLGGLKRDQRYEFMWQAAQEWDSLRKDALTTSISSLANIDGAIIMDGTPQVLAFGVICNNFEEPATQVLRSNDPSDPRIGVEVKAAEFGGSRHQSSIDFCSSNFPAGAIVASHDGGLTVFASLMKGVVIGSRVSLIRSDAEVEPSKQLT